MHNYKDGDRVNLSGLDDQILRNFPVKASVRFFSSSDPTRAKTDATYVANTHEGFFEELERIGIARSNPFMIPDELVPLDSLDTLKTLRKSGGIVLDKIRTTIYDVKRTDALLSTGVQDAATLTAITTSIANENNIYVQAPGLNAVPVDWQPNWFRPRVVFNGKQVYGSSSALHHASHLGFASIGGVTTVEEEYAIYQSKVDSLEVYARCCQRILTAASQVMYQPYAVFCEVVFRIHW